MKYFDISTTLSEQLPGFPGDPRVQLERIHDTEDSFQVTHLHLGSHSGTHIDAPAHLLRDGATVDTVPLDILIGPCRVVDLRGRSGPLSASALRPSELQGVSRLLLRTDNSRLWRENGFVESYVGLTPDAAALFAKSGIRLIGIDYLSIEPFTGTGETHRMLLEAGIVILEGLDLSEVPAGDFELLCLPLKLAGIDGAPCRAVLRNLPA